MDLIHKKNIIHRDIKPDNILIMDRQKLIVQIADLGFACRDDDLQKIKIRCGTPGYVAPELLYKDSATSKVDIFSLGCVFFNLITFGFLFQGRDVKEVINSNMFHNTQ